MATVTVIDVRFRADDGSLTLDTASGWAAVAVGVSTTGYTQIPELNQTADLNIQAATQGAAFADMPATLPVTIRRRPPNRAGSARVLTPPLELTKDSELPSGLTLYTLTKSWDDLPFKSKDAVKEVATVVRSADPKDPSDRAFADQVFRNNLGFVGRGFATQRPLEADPSGGVRFGAAPDDVSARVERPRAELVLLGGGLEVLEAQVPSARDRKVTADPGRALVRSPADIWFYTGHGAVDGSLLAVLPGSHTYESWATPEDFVVAWVVSGNAGRTTDMRIFVSNGCSVLRIDDDGTGPGVRWANLLRDKGGNLTHLLGYSEAGGAPKDVNGGAAIAGELGAALRAGKDPVQSWLKINAGPKRGYWSAVGLDHDGYHAFDPNTHKIAASRAIR